MLFRAQSYLVTAPWIAFFPDFLSSSPFSVSTSLATDCAMRSIPMKVMAMPKLSAQDVRDLIIDRITHGVYPLGHNSRPPSKWRVKLARTGIRSRRPTARSPISDSSRSSRGADRSSRRSSALKMSAIAVQIQRQMAELLRKARGLGIPEADLRQSIDEQITASYRVNAQQAAFVECNMEDARAAVDEIEAMTGYRLAPLLLDDLQSSPSTATDDCAAVFTSLSHQRSE